MFKGIGVAIVLALALGAGCSDSEPDNGGASFSCEGAKSKCPNDGPLDVQTCKTALQDPYCSVPFALWLKCAADKQLCGPDGETDVEATRNACLSQTQAAEQCAEKYYGDAGLDVRTGG